MSKQEIDRWMDFSCMNQSYQEVSYIYIYIYSMLCYDSFMDLPDVSVPFLKSVISFCSLPRSAIIILSLFLSLSLSLSLPLLLLHNKSF